MTIKTKKSLINILFLIILLLTFVTMIILAFENSKPPENTDDKISIALAGVGGFICFAAFIPIILVECDIFFILRYYFFKKEKTRFKTRVNILCGIMDIFIIAAYISYAYICLSGTILSLFIVLGSFFPPIMIVWFLLYIPLRIICFKAVYL